MVLSADDVSVKVWYTKSDSKSVIGEDGEKMKWLKVIGLGILIWSIGLLWPAIHEALTPQVMLGAIVGLSFVGLAQILLGRHLREGSAEQKRVEATCFPRPGSDSRPVKPLGLA
jgi:hypothetical protein